MPFFGAATAITLCLCHFEAIHAACVLLSAVPAPLQGGFVWGNQQKAVPVPAVHVCGRIPSAFNEEPLPEYKTTFLALP